MPNSSPEGFHNMTPYFGYDDNTGDERGDGLKQQAGNDNGHIDDAISDIDIQPMTQYITKQSRWSKIFSRSHSAEKCPLPLTTEGSKESFTAKDPNDDDDDDDDDLPDCSPTFEPPPSSISTTKIRSSRLIDIIRTRKSLKAYSRSESVLLAMNSLDGTRHSASHEADDGPLANLWEVQRLRHSGSSRKESAHQVFTDTWVLREITLMDSILPTSPYQNHLDQELITEGTQGRGSTEDQHSIWKITQSPCGQYLLVGTQIGWIYLYKTAHNDKKGLFDDLPIAIYKAHEGTVVDLLWLPQVDNMPMFVSIGFDRRLCIWLGSEVKPLESVCTSEWSSSISLHPDDSTQLFLGSLDATVQLWRLQIEADADSGRVTARASMIDYVRVPDVVTAVSISPDGQFLIVGVRRGSVAIYDSNTLRFITEIDCETKKTRRWRGSNRRVVGLGWSADSERFVVTTQDSSLRVVNLRSTTGADNRVITRFTGHALQHLLMNANFINPLNGVERILMASEDNHLYCYTPPVGENSPDIAYDKIKVSQQLITSCIVTNGEFNRYVNDSIHDNLRRKLGAGNLIQMDEDPDQVKRVNPERWENPKYFGAIIGTFSGTIKIVFNFGLEV